VDALILNGARHGDMFLDGIQETLRGELGNAGLRSNAVVLRDVPVAYCLGCFECWTRTPGICRTDDAGRMLARAIIASDLVVFLTAVTFGGYSSELKKALDRIIGLVSPFFLRIEGEVHHRPRYERYPAVLGVGVLPGPDAEAEQTFHALVSRNALNLHAPWHASRVLYRGADAAGLRAALRPLVERVWRAA
jgi:hypothetical protein